jgi:hypothetical protein
MVTFTFPRKPYKSSWPDGSPRLVTVKDMDKLTLWQGLKQIKPGQQAVKR